MSLRLVKNFVAKQRERLVRTDHQRCLISFTDINRLRLGECRGYVLRRCATVVKRRLDGTFVYFSQLRGECDCSRLRRRGAEIQLLDARIMLVSRSSLPGFETEIGYRTSARRARTAAAVSSIEQHDASIIGQLWRWTKYHAYVELNDLAESRSERASKPCVPPNRRIMAPPAISLRRCDQPDDRQDLEDFTGTVLNEP